MHGRREHGRRPMDQEQKRRIGKLISDLELCHHKAERHVDLILQAIAEGRAVKGNRRVESASLHPATRMWRNAIDILTAWLSGDSSGVGDLDVGGHAGRQLTDLLGERSALKEWQVQQVVRKLKAASRMYPDVVYHEMVECPDEYRDCREFRDRTVAITIHDTKDGQPAEISLGAAIDHLQPCNWNFPRNLVLVLRAINGDLWPVRPFAAHARNAGLNPIGERMKTIARTLRAYCGQAAAGDADRAVLELLGDRTPDKTELAQMLEQKISDVFG